MYETLIITGIYAGAGILSYIFAVCLTFWYYSKKGLTIELNAVTMKVLAWLMGFSIIWPVELLLILGIYIALSFSKKGTTNESPGKDSN